MSTPERYAAFQRQSRVAKAAAFLSLDCIRPLYGELELAGETADAEALQAAIREAIVAYRPRVEAAPGIDEMPLDFEEQLLATVAERCGDAVATTLHRFIFEAFHESHSELQHASGWHLAFTFAGRAGQVALALPEARRNAWLEQHMEVTDIGELEAQMAAFADQPFSDWDIDVFARRGWDPHDRYAAPFGLATDVVRICRFQRFARRIVTELSDEQLERARVGPARLLEKRGVWMGEPLAPLRDVVGTGALA